MDLLKRFRKRPPPSPPSDLDNFTVMAQRAHVDSTLDGQCKHHPWARSCVQLYGVTGYHWQFDRIGNFLDVERVKELPPSKRKRRKR